MKEQLEAIRAGALAAIGAAGNTGELEALRVQYLGKKGELTAVLKQMGKLSAEERPVMGQLANAVRADVESAIEQQSAVLAEKALEERLEAEALDITVPGKAHKLGHKHPMYTALDEIKEIFISMGFTVLDGPEVELATYNFDKLNAGEGHPSRDWSDTFYFDEDSRVMLRSQTSPMQVRAMETMPLPIRIIAPGRVYRNETTDARHERAFFQYEALIVDKDFTFASGKVMIKSILSKVFGRDVPVRMRAGFFPFVEPGFEIDMGCLVCGGKGCSVCKHVGWIEIMPGGTPHPNVLRAAGLDPDEYTGFYVNIGLDRLVMMRYGVDDVRMFHSADLRFLEQFR